MEEKTNKDGGAWVQISNPLAILIVPWKESLNLSLFVQITQ